MEIGDKNSTLYNNYWIKIIIYIIVIVTLLITLSYYIISNHTTVIEQILISTIAKLEKYDYSFDGNYFKLSKVESNGNKTEIIYRYDDENIKTYIDNPNFGNNSMYVISGVSSSKIRNKDEILANIDNEFLDYKIRQSAGIGGGYNLQSITEAFKLDKIEYESNIDINDTDTVIKIIESIPIDTSYIADYSDGNETIYDEIVDKYIDKRRKELIENGLTADEIENRLAKDRIKYNELYNKSNIIEHETEDIEYKSHNIIVLIPGKTSNNIENEELINTGVIAGNCSNDSESINNMRWTMYKLELISLLEKTILL